MPVALDFQRYDGNPILTSGTALLDEVARYGYVIHEGDAYYLFYTGGNPWEGTQTMAINLATSSDGFAFEKYSGNPILTGDGQGFDAHSVSRPVVVVDDGTWMMYYTAHPQAGHPLGGPAIGRATALGPKGPWTRDEEPVLEMGARTDWDGEPDWFGVVPSSIVLTDEGYRMYYTSHHRGEVSGPRVGGACGLATSSDGIHWTKYDDPATTRGPLGESDPVLRPGGAYDNLHAMDCRVFPLGDGWGMVYASLREGGAGHTLSFATSHDGVHWAKNKRGKPFFTRRDEPLTDQASDGPDVWPLSVISDGVGYRLYYDIGWIGQPIGVGVATGTIEP